jgi:hypothetical protein
MVNVFMVLNRCWWRTGNFRPGCQWRSAKRPGAASKLGNVSRFFVAGVERLGRVASRTLDGFFRITAQPAVQLRGVGTFQVSFAF